MRMLCCLFSNAARFGWASAWGSTVESPNSNSAHGSGVKCLRQEDSDFGQRPILSASRTSALSKLPRYGVVVHHVIADVMDYNPASGPR